MGSKARSHLKEEASNKKHFLPRPQNPKSSPLCGFKADKKNAAASTLVSEHYSRKSPRLVDAFGIKPQVIEYKESLKVLQPQVLELVLPFLNFASPLPYPSQVAPS